MVLRLFYIFLVLFCTVISGPVFAAEDTTEQQAVETEKPAFPGLSEMGVRSAALTDFVVRSEERLLQLADLKDIEESFSELKSQLEGIMAEVEPLGPPEEWYVDRLHHYLSLLGQIRQGFNSLQQNFAGRQHEVEIIRDQAQQDQQFWTDWEDSLKQQGVKLPTQIIAQVHQQLSQLQKALKKTEATLLKLQEKSAAFQQELMLASEQWANALDKLRKATFRKNAYSFFSRDFHRQFTPALVTQIKNGILAAFKFDQRYLLENLWLFSLLGGGLMFAAVLLRQQRQRLLTATGDWNFILQQPFAVAGFLFAASCWVWLPAPPALFRFILNLLAVLAATTMALALLETRRQIRVLLLAAGVFLLTSFFRLIAFPQPLLRIYVALLAIILIPVLSRQIKRSRIRSETGQQQGFRSLLRLAVGILTVSLLAQSVGYMNFSTWLVQATFETGVVFLFVRIAVLLLSGAVDLAGQLLIQAKYQFFENFGDQLNVRLKHVFKIVLYGFAFFYLLPVWRFFTTLADGWNYFRTLSFSIGNFDLTLQMFISALVAFYLALQVSWLLQAVTETRLKKQQTDRGVQEAVKKLVHYAIVLVGFMLALSMLGMGIQNFVVLLGAFGVGIGFGLQDIVNNFLSGLILLFERPIKVGDGVLIEGEYGTVQRIGLRSTVVQNLDEAELIVPNSQMISQKVTNWTLSNRRVRLVVPVGVAYGSDLEKVLAILTETAREHPEVLDTPHPTALFVQFGASSLDFELRAWISNVDNRPRIKNELLLDIDRRFRAAKIEIPFSQHDLHIRSVSPGVLPGPRGDG